MDVTKRVLTRLQTLGLSRRGTLSRRTRRADHGAGASGPLWGGVLGSILLAWCVLVMLAPELGSLAAVFGSPLLALFVTVRLLTATEPAGGRKRGRTASELAADPVIRQRILAHSGVCADCGASGPLMLRAVLPVGRSVSDPGRRFVTLCRVCDASRADPARPAVG